jgi:hypothetical protein
MALLTQKIRAKWGNKNQPRFKRGCSVIFQDANMNITPPVTKKFQGIKNLNQTLQRIIQIPIRQFKVPSQLFDFMAPDNPDRKTIIPEIIIKEGVSSSEINPLNISHNPMIRLTQACHNIFTCI